MPKEELQRLKNAFFRRKENAPAPDRSPRLSPSLFISISFSVILLAALISFFTKERPAPLDAPHGPLAKKSTPQEQRSSPALPHSIASSAGVPEEIDSLFLIQEMNQLKPLLKELPITLNGSSATLVVNLKQPLNIYDKSLKVYFQDTLEKLDVILKDYLYFSNSQNPVTVNMNNATVLEIDAGDLELAKSDLNLYKVTQLRIIFDLTKLPFDFKIKGIEIAKR